jgi:hypothetical protein
VQHECRPDRPPITELARNQKVLALGVGLFSIASALSGALWRPLDFGELIEFYVERLPSLPQILHILATHPPTTDPPLGYAIVHASLLVFGPSALSERLPAMIGFAVALAGLFLFLNRRIPVEAALIAPILVCASSSFFFAYQGRHYGMLLGASAVLLLSWQSVDPLRPNLLALARITFSLAFALLIHYYAVLLCLPILAAELVRTWHRRKIFFSPLIALALAYPVCAAWIPFWKASMAFKAHIWFVADLNTALDAYSDLVNPAWVIFTVVLTMSPLVLLLLSKRHEEKEVSERNAPTGLPSIPAQELAALLVLALLPIFGYGLTKFTGTGLFQTRYVLPATLGCSGLISVLCGLAIARTRHTAVVIPLALTLGLCVLKLREARDFRPQLVQLASRLTRLDASMPGTIVIPEPQPFLQYYFYATPHLRTKLAMPLDDAAILALTHIDTMQRSYRPLRDLEGLATAIPDLSLFLEQHPTFHVLEILDRSHVWLVPTLLSRGYEVTLERETDANRIYRVGKSMPSTRSVPSAAPTP